MGRRYPDTPPVHNFPLAKAASEAGGILIGVKIPRLRPGLNGGCGSPTHVAGTNGGTMPCGALLTRFGETKPYYCGNCQPA